jgi:transcriptional regulator with XRE-family HTH domain
MRKYFCASKINAYNRIEEGGRYSVQEIRDLRKALGIPQGKLAERIGITQTKLSLSEAGKRLFTNEELGKAEDFLLAQIGADWKNLRKNKAVMDAMGAWETRRMVDLKPVAFAEADLPVSYNELGGYRNALLYPEIRESLGKQSKRLYRSLLIGALEGKARIKEKELAEIRKQIAKLEAEEK